MEDAFQKGLPVPDEAAIRDRIFKSTWRLLISLTIPRDTSGTYLTYCLALLPTLPLSILYNLLYLSLLNLPALSILLTLPICGGRGVYSP
jgi:hypothetical protein